MLSSSSLVATATGKAAVARLLVDEERAAREWFSGSIDTAEMQVGLPDESRCFDLMMRTGESEVDGWATQSIILVKKGCWQWVVWSHTLSLGDVGVSSVFASAAMHV